MAEAEARRAAQCTFKPRTNEGAGAAVAGVLLAGDD